MTGNFLNSGYSLEQAKTMAYHLLDLTVWKQYSLMAYNDVFLLVGVLTLACLPLVFFVKYKKAKPGTKVVMAHE
jgi:DHA2 family multidrug resistance protein